MESQKDIEMMPPQGRSVTKRDGNKQLFDSNKILHRVKKMAYGLNEEFVTFQEVIDKVTSGLYDSKSFLVNKANFK